MLEPGQTMLLHSDGVAEAHGPAKEMFGFPRLQDVVGARSGRGEVIDRVLTELGRFTGADWEQEDDITLVALTRYGAVPAAGAGGLDVSFQVASEPGNEKQVSERVAEAVAALELAPSRLEQLKTAVSEAAMNAIEHGNESHAPSFRSMSRSGPPAANCVVAITDHGGGREIPEAEDARPRGEARRAAEAARLGPLPDQEHGRRRPHLERRKPSHRRARDAAGRRGR